MSNNQPDKRLKRLIFIIVNTILFLSRGFSQDISISGIVNHYLAVDAVLPDRVGVIETAELAYFEPGDKVLIIQITGGELNDEDDTGWENFLTKNVRVHKTFNNTGKFEVLQLDEIVESEGKKFVVFTDNLSNTYDQGEKIQLVRFIEGETVTVTGTVTARDWDGATGGVVAIIGMDSIKLNANIDVSHQGFRGGAVPSENYTAGCRQDIDGAVVDTLYFLPTHLNRSGNKGEGIITVNWPYTKGTGFALNGGGAGNGLFSGGAGGSNYSLGGDGGQQSSNCGAYLTPAWGGYGCYLIYTPVRRQIIMGGGGGSGVKSSSATASKGGDGGGIVILITEIIDGNGNSILADGENAGTAAGSGGGGGAGGTILIDATVYGDAFNIYAKGGDGGSTNDNCTGSGGGGSGGVFWHSGTSIPSITVDLTEGQQGYVSSPCIFHTGNGGYEGASLENLLMPLTGFLFNTIRGVDTLCAGQVPEPITGTWPKGGDGFYSYLWEQSTDQTTWISAFGTPELTAFQSEALYQTTYFRRIVNSADIADTSRIIEIFVYPAISNNIIAGNDTICFEDHGDQLTGSLPSGGNSEFEYQWQISGNLSDWNNIGNPVYENIMFDPGILTATSNYRRLVSSTAYCHDTSGYITITVLPDITNNQFITEDTVICENLGPGLLNATNPGGGDGSYMYSWQSRPETGSWQDVASSNVLQYDPGQLSQTTLFRRIVYSGNDHACIDTSATVKTISVLPAIANNILITDSSRYCAGDIPLTINGEQPSGGSGSYNYEWQQRISGSWQNITDAFNEDYLPDEIVEANTEFRRIVISGIYNACIDTSDALGLTVIPYIINELGLDDQIICQFTAPDPFIASPASGGLNGITYEWIQQQQGSAEWNMASGIAGLASYTSVQLENSMLFARKVYSDICTSISDTINITVYPAIKNNSILGAALQYTCFNTEKSLGGTLPVDGKTGEYAYLWEESSNGIDWVTASEIPNDGMDYQTGSLSDLTYFRRIVFSSFSGQECIDTSDLVEIRINPLPSGDVITARDTLCAGETLYVAFTVSGANGPFEVSIGNGSLTQSKDNIASSPDSIAFMMTGNSQLTMVSIVDDSLCYADLTGNTGLAEAVVFEVPVADAGADSEVCGNVFTLGAIKSVTGSDGLWTATNTDFDDPENPAAIVTVGSYGPFTFTWTETNWQCADEDQVEVIFYEQPQVPDAGPDQVLEFTYATTLEALPPDVGTGSWQVVSGNGVFNDPSAPVTGVTNLDDNNLLRWTVINGVCDAKSDSVVIMVTPLVIGKGFTPNGDTKNDFFEIGSANAEWIKIKIFNSLGILVYESDDYTGSDLWDGRNMNGVELPEGTYFYIAEVKVPGRDREVIFKSFVEILR
ncbi:MAG: gliding motility-associated C-terminal domain-containing protein [Bacteroidales bacterium]|nr:gliding motility-associated C-terminal domain-containing protein [Bacteroidales bacterium]